MKIALFGNWYKRSTLNEVAHILDFMESREVEVLLSRELRDEMNLREKYSPFDSETTDEIDFALSVGGDGTFLYTASVIGDKNIPILGINCGRLGFLADVQTTEVDFILDQLVQNNYTIEQRNLLRVTSDDSSHIEMPIALNEIAVMKQELSSMIHIEAKVNGELLNVYKADGLVVSTPTGSTAYNLSVGGPLVTPQARAIIVSPIATHALNVRPIVLPDDWQLDLSIKSRSHSYLLSVDGRSITMREDTKLHIEKANYTIKVVQIGANSFLNSLRQKLNWGE